MLYLEALAKCFIDEFLSRNLLICAISLDKSYVLLMFNIVKASIMKNGQLMKKDSLDLVLLNHYAISNMNFLSKIFDIVSISQFV